MPDTHEPGAATHSDPRFQQASAAMQSGRLQEAEQLVRAILSENDRDALAIHLLGIIAVQARKIEAAVELIERAVALAPNEPGFRNTLGYVLRAAKRYPDAIEQFQRAVDLRPDYVEAINNLGISLAESKQYEKAISAYQSALAIRPDYPEVLNNMANALARLGRHDEAISQFEHAIRLRPDYADAHANLGDALLSKDKENRPRTIECYNKAVSLNPQNPDVWMKLGSAYYTDNQLEESETAFRRALRINPNNLRCLNAIAATLEKRGNLQGAASHLRHALTIAPDDVSALKSLGHITLKLGNAVEAKHVLTRARELVPADPDTLYSYANCLLRMEQLQPAMDLYLRVRELQPDQARGTFAPAAVLLMDGQYEKGWAAYESRYNMTAFKPNVPNIRERLWDGSDLNGRKLLVHVEQGYGDTIQFCRYIPMLQQRLGTGGRVIFLCEPEVYRLMSTLEGVDELHHLAQNKVQIVYDVQLPLLSLPHRFGTVLETVPNKIPYLGVPEEAQRTEPLPQSEAVAVKAGIVWTGRPTHSDNLYRSIPLPLLAQLFNIDGVDFHSLQVGNGVADLKPYLARPNVFDHSSTIKDFADTAAIISQLDVVITVDTAVCHLAGAMGKDVWTMLPFGGEWRWLRNTEATPWYPSMKLVRQRILGDWGMTLDRVREGLTLAVAQRRADGSAPPAPALTSADAENNAENLAAEASPAKKAAAKKSSGKKGAGKKSPGKKSPGKKSIRKKPAAKS